MNTDPNREFTQQSPEMVVHREEVSLAIRMIQNIRIEIKDSCDASTLYQAQLLEHLLTSLEKPNTRNVLLTNALSEITEVAEEALGDWISIAEPYAPSWTSPYKTIIGIAEAVIE
jgi:hypothetical protein